MVAALSAKQQADAAAIAREMAQHPEPGSTRRSDRGQRSGSGSSAAEAEAKAKARGEAIGGFLSNVGSAIDPFGNDDQSASAEAPKVIDPTLVAPVPAPRIQRG